MKTDWFELRAGAPAPGALHRPALPDRGGQRHHAVRRDRGRQARPRRALARRRPARRAGGARQPVEDRRGDGGQARQDAWTARSGGSSSTSTWPRTTRRRCARCKRAERHETVTYFEETLGRPPGRSDDPLTRGREDGHHAGRLASRRWSAASSGCEELSARRLRRPALPRPRVGHARADAARATSCSRAT